MKKLFIISILVFFSVAAFGQAKKPTIMVVPSDAWCNLNGYVTEFDNAGTIERVPDYATALSSDPNMLLVISQLGQMMANEGFPLKDLGASLRSLQTQAAEDAVSAMAEGGLTESPLDRLKRVANADIWLQLTYSINRVGPKYSLTFNLQALDAYTNKQVAAVSGTGEPSNNAELPVLLEEAVGAHTSDFYNRLQVFFDDMFANGREITLVCRRTNSSAIDYETEFDGEELGFLIEDWLAENAVGGRYSTSEASENRMTFEQVRIPAENDARRWANGLRRHLREAYEINADLGIRGLGQAIITLE